LEPDPLNQMGLKPVTFLALRGVQGPVAALILGPVDELADADIGVQPFGVELCQLEAKKAAPGVAENEELVLGHGWLV
jgi:hypothetical protein